MTKTVAQLKAEFATEGKTFVAWATERGYNPTYVSRILHGSIKANYGKAHKIAVELGLIDGSQGNSNDNATCNKVGLAICQADLTKMEQWFIGIYRSLNDDDKNTIERIFSLMDLENIWRDADEQ